MVWGFDPTPKSIAWIAMNSDGIKNQFTFSNYGLGESSGLFDFFLPRDDRHVSGSFVEQSNVNLDEPIKVHLKSLNDIVDVLGHRKIDVLKMDIEGAEYAVLDSILKSNLDIVQILIEFHERLVSNGREKTKQAIKKLNKKGFEIFAISDTFQEVSLINKSYLGWPRS